MFCPLSTQKCLDRNRKWTKNSLFILLTFRSCTLKSGHSKRHLHQQNLSLDCTEYAFRKTFSHAQFHLKFCILFLSKEISFCQWKCQRYQLPSTHFTCSHFHSCLYTHPHSHGHHINYSSPTGRLTEVSILKTPWTLSSEIIFYP